MKNNFYKLYFKNSSGAYENAEIYENMKQVMQRIAKDSRGYLIIHRHDNRDEIVEMKQAEIKIVDDIKSNVEVKTKVFYLDDKEQQKKRKMRKEEKRKLKKEMEEYIDR